MLLTQYSQDVFWYMPYVDEIFTGITIEDIEYKEEKILNDKFDAPLSFSVDFCQAVYRKLLENNNPRDIHIYLAALRMASYNPNVVIDAIYKRKPNFFIERPVVFLMLMSREYIFNYSAIRAMYEDWYLEQ